MVCSPGIFFCLSFSTQQPLPQAETPHQSRDEGPPMSRLSVLSHLCPITRSELAFPDPDLRATRREATVWKQPTTAGDRGIDNKRIDLNRLSVCIRRGT